MLEASLTFGLSEFDKATFDLEHKQLPYAMMLALNDTAKGARKAVQVQMGKSFDRPTPFAKRGVVYEQATKDKLDARVVIYGSKTPHGGLPAAYFLGPQVDGGQRRLKAFEVQLKDRGLLPEGHVVVPAERTKLDRYGNVSQGQLNRIMSGLKIDYRGAGATRVASTKKGKAKRARGSRGGVYFVPGPGSHLAPGVWLELGFPYRAIFPVLMFVKQGGYVKRLPFHRVVGEYSAQHLPKNFTRGWNRALRTAR
ncbi:hypothetical protein [Hoeflea sp.]|uniref:hypothetical protein n=1 Tax=Hoeflea sp. TaxID=1940281 RepID=UPI0019C05A4D|nr:hypothetical protein [Hoeflea sp.]MBC7280023.1 hypothetical protein [Hoeflea sp.]